MRYTVHVQLILNSFFSCVHLQCIYILFCFSYTVLYTLHMSSLTFFFLFSPPNIKLPSHKYLNIHSLLSFSLFFIQGMVAICEMVEFYGCACKLLLAHNNRLRPRAWLTIGRTLKKVSYLYLFMCVLYIKPICALLLPVHVIN